METKIVALGFAQISLKTILETSDLDPALVPEGQIQKDLTTFNSMIEPLGKKIAYNHQQIYNK